MALPQAIEETDAGTVPDRAVLMMRDRPLEIRGLVRDWPRVRLAQTSDTAFAERLAALGNGTPVDKSLCSSSGPRVAASPHPSEPPEWSALKGIRTIRCVPT